MVRFDLFSGGTQCFLHHIVNSRGRGKNVPRRQVIRPAVGFADYPTRFLYQERASRDIPFVQVELPESVDTPAGDVREVECRRAGAPNAGCLRQEFEQTGEIVFQPTRITYRKSCR